MMILKLTTPIDKMASETNDLKGNPLGETLANLHRQKSHHTEIVITTNLNRNSHSPQILVTEAAKEGSRHSKSYREYLEVVGGCVPRVCASVVCVTMVCRLVDD